MTTSITIREQDKDDQNQYQAIISFNYDEFPCSITNPCSSEQLAELDWYFKEYNDPDEDLDRAKSVAASIKKCGQQLFQQVFCDRALRRYDREKHTGIQCIEIIGSPAFHSLPWETLYDPDDSQPLALNIPIVRQYTSETKILNIRQSPIINLLIVTARPHRENDINYRAISRPLVQSLRQAKLRVSINILRPCTIRALQDHLSTRKGYYHIIHLDVHGALQGDKSLVFLESTEENNRDDPIEASQLAQLLVQHQIPITILNACESGKQVGISETSLSGKFMEAGMPLVLAMRYTVTVAAASFFMKTLYQHLFGEPDIATAIRYARNILYNNKERHNACNEPLELEEWIIPVVYQNTPTALLPLRDFLPEEQAQREAYDARDFYPNPEIVGRDLDILEIETKIAQRNILLIRGCTGIGKTTLVKHLAWWWQNTYDVDKVFYFGYDEKLWTQEQVLQRIAKKLNLAKVQGTIVTTLIKERHLLIFDALECINKSEQTALHEFLMRLQNGKSLILLSSQQNLKWLAKDTFGDSVYELAGIDNTSANILIKSKLNGKISDQDIRNFYLQLEKNPLLLEIAIQAILENETALLSVLKTTMSNTDKQGEAKQQYILHEVINYIYNRQTLDEQGLLLCLAPLNFAMNTEALSNYSQQLQQKSVLAHLPFDNWEKVLEKLVDWGLLRLSSEVLLQSYFGDFLRSRLVEKVEWLAAIEMAFEEYCDRILENDSANSIDPNMVSPNDLPYTGKYLLGRNDQIKDLDDAWKDSNVNIISLVAWGGVGKTAILKYWLQKMEKVDYAGAKRVYITSFYSQGTSDETGSPEPFIEKALRWFNDKNPNEGTPKEKGERLARLIKSERTLLLLDGIEPLQHPPGPNGGRFNEESFKALILGLATYNPGLCVITTRYPITELESFEEQQIYKSISLKNLKPADGVELLQKLGVKGDKNELEQATKEFDGHCFALTLLANYINDAYDGDIRCIVEIGPLEKEESQGGHAQRIMKEYEKWLGKGSMLDVLRIIGLFNQPADEGCIKALRASPIIHGLTDNLIEISNSNWKKTLNKLSRTQLLQINNDDTLDAHPLVREYFSNRLYKDHRKAWRKGHKRLYKHLKNNNTTPEFPNTLDEMMPLYSAIVHGCNANKHQEAFDEIYWSRVQRGPKQYFSTDKLGAFYTDLRVLAHFFKEPWSKPVTKLNEDTIATIQNKVGFCLKALGQFKDAIEPIQAAIKGYKEQKAWKKATGVASSLGYLYLWSGKVTKAVEITKEGVSFADQINDQDRILMRTRSRTAWADMLHHAGKLEEAQDIFQAAEDIQTEDKRQPKWLYAAQSFRYCDLLLSQQNYQEVKKRALYALGKAEQSSKKRPLEIAWHNINLGRAFHLAEEYEQSLLYLNTAVTNLEIAKRLDTLPVVLIARAALNRDLNNLNEAYADIDHAIKIAERGQMKLHIADCYLEYARLHLARGEKEKFLQNLQNAKKMIIEMNYHRRDHEVKELEEKM